MTEEKLHFKPLMVVLVGVAVVLVVLAMSLANVLISEEVATTTPEEVEYLRLETGR